jgi:hypothetical protein
VGILLNKCYLKIRKNIKYFPFLGNLLLTYYPKCGIIIHR